MYYTIYFQHNLTSFTLIGHNRVEVCDIINRFIKTENISTNPITPHILTNWIAKKKKSDKFHFVSVSKFYTSKIQRKKKFKSLYS